MEMMKVTGLKQLEILLLIRKAHSEGFKGSIPEWERKIGYRHSPNRGREVVQSLISKNIMDCESGKWYLNEKEFDTLLMQIPLVVEIYLVTTQRMSPMTLIKGLKNTPPLNLKLKLI